MCPMCEKRAEILMQQQTVVEISNPASKASNSQTSKSYLFRNPFKTCKPQCCSPLCESQRTSIAEGRRSSIQPLSGTPEHSGELTYLHDEYRVSESPLSAIEQAQPANHHERETEQEEELEEQHQPEPEPKPPVERKRKRRGLLSRLKRLTHGAAPQQGRADKVEREPSSNESSFSACGKKVMAVADDLEHEEKARAGAMVLSNATLLASETDFDTVSEVSMNVTETNMSESTMTMVSMMNFNGSFSSPFGFSYREISAIKSSAYDDDASSFAIVPRTSMNSSFAQDGHSDASGLSDRFGELDIGYLSLEESGEGPEFDDTVSISSSQHEDLDLDMHPQDDTVSESDLDHDYSISTDSQEWCTETEDASSVLHRSRAHNSKLQDRRHLQEVLHTTPPPLQPADASKVTPPSVNQVTPQSTKSKDPPSAKRSPLFQRKDSLRKESYAKRKPLPSKKSSSSSPETSKNTCTEFLCSRCSRKENKAEVHQQATTKKVTRKENPMSTYFQTFNMDGEDQAVMAAKVVVLLGKYGNRKGLRVAGLPPGPKDLKDLQTEMSLSARELDRLRSMICPNSDAVSAFQNEVARMMLEGVDVPELNIDVEQFIAGYMKLSSPFYIDLIEDFFKSVCIDCFGHMEKVGRGTKSVSAHQRPAVKAVLKARKPKTIARNTTRR